MLQIGTLCNDFLRVSRFPITDTECSVWSFLLAARESCGGRFNLEGNSSPPHALSKSGRQRGHSLWAWISLPTGSAQARPAPSGSALTLHKADTHRPHPGLRETGLCAPFSCRRVLGPLVPWATGTWTPWTLLVPSGCCFCRYSWWEQCLAVLLRSL